MKRPVVMLSGIILGSEKKESKIFEIKKDYIVRNKIFYVYLTIR